MTAITCRGWACENRHCTQPPGVHWCGPCPVDPPFRDCWGDLTTGQEHHVPPCPQAFSKDSPAEVTR